MDQSDLPWSDLPELVLATIAVKLSSPFTFSAFARVCRSWRSVARSAKFDFMAFQPPLLLILSSFPSATSVRLYSPADRRSYSAESPALISLLRNSYILTHHHGYIVAIDKSISNEDLCTPTVKNLCTDETYSFPSCPRNFKRGLLTSPPNSGSCMLILYRRHNDKEISCCRVGDPSGWHLLRLPEFPHSAVSHDNTLYLCSVVTGNVMVVAIDNAGSLNLVRVIESPCCKHGFFTVTVFEDELVMIPMFLVIWRTSVYRLKLCDGGEGEWKKGLRDGCSLFLCEEDDKESGCYVWSGRMTTVGGVQGLKSRSVLDGEEDRFKRIKRKGFWVHPRDLERWGVKNMMV